MSDAPKIVWPAPGLPVLLENRAQFALLVAHDGHTLADLGSWAQGLGVRTRAGHSERLRIVGIEAAEARDVEPLASAYTTLPESRGLHWAKVAVRLPSPIEVPAPRRSRVMDLTHGDDVVRSNAIGVLASQRRDLAIAFASDLHVARIWDTLGAAVERYAPDLSAAFLHPVRLFERFIHEANAMAGRGDLDLVVLGGDLVDHVHTSPRGQRQRRPADTNVQRFLDLVASLEVPAVMIPGNHDYRAFPWRPRLPTLDVVGLPQRRMRAVLEAAGLWDAWPLRPSDLAALHTEDETGAPAVAHHLNLLAPATDFTLEARGLRMIFAATGRDLLPRWRELEWRRRLMIPRTLTRSWEDPDSEGFYDDQIVRMRHAIDGTRGAAIFFHAPLLHTGAPGPVQHRIGRLDPGDRDDRAARLTFERRLLRAGVRRGVFFRNVAPLIRTVVSASGPVTIMSGHVHRGSAIELDRRTLAVRSVPMQAPATGDTIGIYTAPALGQMRHRHVESQSPGYLLARFADGQLRSMEQRAI